MAVRTRRDIVSHSIYTVTTTALETVARDRCERQTERIIINIKKRKRRTNNLPSLSDSSSRSNG
jgi:hypothetical protein